MGVLIGIVAALCVGAPAASAGGWLPAQVLVTNPNSLGWPAGLAVSPDGTTVAAWSEYLGGHTLTRAAIRSPGGAFSAPVTLSNPALDIDGLTAPVIDAQDNVTVAWITGGVVRAASHPSGGTWSASQDLSGTDAHDVSLAAGGGGGAIAVWTRVVPGGERVEGAIRPVGATLFGASAAVSDVGQLIFGQARAAMDPAGDVAVIWQRRFDPGGGSPMEVDEATAKAAGQPFPTGAPGRVELTSTGGGDAVADSNVFDIAMTPDGHVLAAWEAYGSGPRVYTRDRPLSGTFAGSLWDGSSTPVSPNGTTGVRLALDAAGNAAAAWSDTASGNVIHGALRPAMGTFTDLPLSPAMSETPALAMSGAGEAAVAWRAKVGQTFRIFASRRPAAGTFEAPVELASATLPASVDSSPGVGVDDQGNAVVAYIRVASSDNALMVASYDNAPPVLSDVTDPGIVVTGHPLTLSATASDRVSAATLHWDFGDGGSADGASVTHAFTAAGTFTVTVTATDGAGNAASATRTAVVVLPSPAARPGIPALKPVPAKAVAKWRHLSRGRTAVRSLSLTGAKAGDTIKLSCSGHGCAPSLKKAKTIKPKQVKRATVSLSRYVKALKLRPKAKLTIAVSRKGYKKVTITYTMVKGKDPRRTVR
jgi:hypothetical protein